MTHPHNPNHQSSKANEVDVANEAGLLGGRMSARRDERAELDARRAAGLKRRHAKKRREAERRAVADLTNQLAALRDELTNLEQSHRAPNRPATQITPNEATDRADAEGGQS